VELEGAQVGLQGAHPGLHGEQVGLQGAHPGLHGEQVGLQGAQCGPQVGVHEGVHGVQGERRKATSVPEAALISGGSKTPFKLNNIPVQRPARYFKEVVIKLLLLSFFAIVASFGFSLYNFSASTENDKKKNT